MKFILLGGLERVSQMKLFNLDTDTLNILDIDYLNLFPISTNITFLCPFGYVFSNDWFATPMLIISCQESGAFEMPDWDEYVCVEGELLTIESIALY